MMERKQTKQEELGSLPNIWFHVEGLFFFFNTVHRLISFMDEQEKWELQTSLTPNPKCTFYPFVQMIL